MRKCGKDLILSAVPTAWNVEDVFFTDIYCAWDVEAKFHHRNTLNEDAKHKFSWIISCKFYMNH